MKERIGRWRVDLLTTLPLFVIILPCIGLLLLPFFPALSPYPLGAAPSFIPFILYTIFAVLFAWAMLVTLAQLARIRPVTAASPADVEVSPHILVVATLIIFVVTLSQVDVIALFAGDIYKGDLRVDGQLLAILTKFVTPTFFGYACFAWRNERSPARMVSVFVVGIVTFVSAFLLGTKAGALIAILPGVLVLFWHGVSVRTFLHMTVASLAVILAASSLFDTSGQGIVGSLVYVLNRTFMLTAEIPYRITVAALAGDSGIDYPRTLMSVLTNTVLRQVIESPVDLYTYSFSGAVSALFYPEMIPQINSGEWNHTPPVYSEGIVAFGPLFGLMALIAGSAGGALIYAIRRLAASQRLILTSLMLTYFVFVYIAWLNSAGVAGLIHPFPAFALAATGGGLVALRLLGSRLHRVGHSKAV